MNYANVWKRFLAGLIDSIILSIFNSIIISVISKIFVSGTAGEETSGVILAVVINWVIFIIISWLYYAIQESSPRQATIGKQAMGLVVTDMNGEKISFVKATIRNFAKIISAIILYIGYFMAFFTEKKQGLHDMMAGTLILQK